MTDFGLAVAKTQQAAGNQPQAIEVPVQRYASYGGIEEATLSRRRFAIAPETVRDFEGISGMEISFTISTDEFEKITVLLKGIFREHGGLKIRDE